MPPAGQALGSAMTPHPLRSDGPPAASAPVSRGRHRTTPPVTLHRRSVRDGWPPPPLPLGSVPLAARPSPLRCSLDGSRPPPVAPRLAPLLTATPLSPPP